MKIDATIMAVGQGEFWAESFDYVNPNITNLTNWDDGNDFDIWKLDVKLGKTNLTVLLKSKAADVASDEAFAADEDSKEMFIDKAFCSKLIKKVVQELRKARWVPQELTEGRQGGWSFTGDCSLNFDDETGKYGYDT
jgi:hypothetical protein